MGHRLNLRVPQFVHDPRSTSSISYLNRIDGLTGSVLELGTGSGAGAIILSRTARQVTATDIDPVTVRIARRNAKRNLATGITWRVGPDYHPIGDRCFDHIVGQPPFMPASEAVGRSKHDGGLVGDETLRCWMVGAPNHLRPGGSALFLGVLRDPAFWTTVGWQIEKLDDAPHGLYGVFRWHNLS